MRLIKAVPIAGIGQVFDQDRSLTAAPVRATSNLMAQAQRKMKMGDKRLNPRELRNKLLRDLWAGSLKRATVAGTAPGANPNAVGSGGSGYSGRPAAVLGQQSVAGTSTTLGPPRPKA